MNQQFMTQEKRTTHDFSETQRTKYNRAFLKEGKVNNDKFSTCDCFKKT